MTLATVANPDVLEALGVLAGYGILIVIASTGLFLVLEAAGVFDNDEYDSSNEEGPAPR